MDRELGRQFLLLLKDCLDAAGIPFFLMQGTALGAYRDGDFTPTERDIDLGVLWEDFKPKQAILLGILIDRGVLCDIGERFTPSGNCHTIVASWQGVKADIVSWFNNKHGMTRFAVAPSDLKPHYCIVHPSKLFDEYKLIEFFGAKFRIPLKIEEYLEREYGDWQTPREDHVSRSRVYGYLDNVPDWNQR